MTDELFTKVKAYIENDAQTSVFPAEMMEANRAYLLLKILERLESIDDSLTRLVSSADRPKS